MVVRRASLAKVPTGIEAPITKVIGIILSAQQAAPMYVAQALEKVRRETDASFIMAFCFIVLLSKHALNNIRDFE